MEAIKEALTFDDVLLIPKFSSTLPTETNLSINLAKNLKLKIPFLSSAMDTVTESKMAIAIAHQGGLGVIHRNLSINSQVKEIKKVKNKKLLVGAAVGTSEEDILRAKSILDAGLDLLVIDTAHGHSLKVINTLKKIRKFSNKIPICVGNIATGEAAVKLYNEGADILKVGIGPGSICTTRMIAGIGVPQITAIRNVKKSMKNKTIKIISDGGIKFSGGLVKAIAAGADAIMMGSIFAGTEESPGKKFKYKDKSKFVPEGVEARVLYKGSVEKIIYQLQGGLRSSMGYIGAKKIEEIYKKGKFIKITKAGFYESMVHSVEAIKEETNYKL